MQQAITHEEIRSIRALKDRKSRHEQGLFVVEGVKGVMELCASACEVVRIYVEARTEDAVLAVIPGIEARLTRVGAAQMQRLSTHSTPPGVLAVARIPEVPLSHFVWDAGSPKAWGDLPILLVADGIQDPGNLGTLIRSADWFGARGVWVSEHSVDPWNPKTIQAAMGSAFRVPVRQAPLMDCLQCNPQLPWVVLDAGGEPLTAHRWQACVLLVGSESHGVSPHWLDHGDPVLSIPGAGHAESLNAGVAGSIALSWAYAQVPFSPGRVSP
jgi:TrmH family RNA methyltransferase